MVVPGQEHVLLTAPVAATDVQADAHTLDALGDAVEQPGGILQLGTRIPAGGECGSHERAALAILAGRLAHRTAK